ncbi:MAG: tRNA (adenine-N1)-methyltransferase [Pirellulales bacterium]|nr:tRNA (adenine-N1)-methyltransferase [Pirellulales bacterium]
MNWITCREKAQEGDLALLIGLKQKYFIITLVNGSVLETHRGIVKHDDIIGKKWGSEIFSHKESPFYLFQPGIEELIKTTKRNTQIMYAKDIGYTLLKLNIVNGTKVIEAGTGSGSLTQVIAAVIGNEGHLYSYEVRPEMQNLAKKNLRRLGIEERVTFIQKNIEDGFDQKNIDAIFLDVPNPYDYLEQVKKALIPGGFFGTILPTTNQIIKLLIELRRKKFAFIEVSEIMLRHYQAEETKLRPTDRMVAHTGYLIFARPISKSQ